MSYVPVDAGDVALAALFIGLHGVLSLRLGLGLGKKLVIAALRMTLQLLLVGLVLRALFESVSALWTACACCVMVAVAGREILARQDGKLRGRGWYGLGAGSMLLAGSLVTIFALTTQVQPDPWYHPRYALPLLGMVLGNTMTGISLGLDTLTTGLERDRAAVEARLALGATRWEATAVSVRAALRSALTPILNSMSAAGLVSLPGMMTGQILAGVEPMEAVRYQLLIIFLIAGGTGIGAIVAVFGGVARLTDERHRLRLERLA